MKKVIKVEKKVVIINKKNSGNNGIGSWIKDKIVEGMLSDEGVDFKEIDKLCFEKFGVSKSGKESRMNSIRWYMNDMKENGYKDMVFKDK